MPPQPSLKRSLNLPLVVLYGLGTTIGAGIYALTGKVAAVAGMLAPLSFLFASCLAAFTAFSFAEMCARFPRAAGEAVYVTEGLRTPRLGVLVGLLVILAACVSSAALMKSFSGYLEQFVTLPDQWVVTGLVLALACVTAWGITESVSMAALFTLVEIFGLLLIIWAARGELQALPQRWPEFAAASGTHWIGVFGASLLAFYAFLGFEDMVNVAEEVQDAERVMPRAITWTLGITVILYIALTLSAVLTVPPTELGTSKAPLSLVYQRATGGSSAPITAIALFAIVNGALIQIILASRVVYGLATQGALPAMLGHVHNRTRTPVYATSLIAAVILILALWLPLAWLAEATSTLTLAIFALVNLALWRLKQREPGPSRGWKVPVWIPVAGFFVSLGFVLYGLARLAGATA